MANSFNYRHSLRLEDLSLQVRLGNSEQERSQPQEVRISLEFRFPTAPGACISDDLDDTVCYAKVCEAIRSHLLSREFKLIERIAFECEDIVRECLPRSDAPLLFAVAIHKVRPPVAGVFGGAVFRCGDFLI